MTPTVIITLTAMNFKFYRQPGWIGEGRGEIGEGYLRGVIRDLRFDKRSGGIRARALKYGSESPSESDSIGMLYGN